MYIIIFDMNVSLNKRMYMYILSCLAIVVYSNSWTNWMEWVFSM